MAELQGTQGTSGPLAAGDLSGKVHLAACSKEQTKHLRLSSHDPSPLRLAERPGKDAEHLAGHMVQALPSAFRLR